MDNENTQMEHEMNYPKKPIDGFKWEIDVLHFPSIYFICPYCADTFKRVRSHGKGRIFQFCPSCGMKLVK